MTSIAQAFSAFKTAEQQAWKSCQWYIPNKALLEKPSGILQAPIAHHLHQPSFATENLENGETADPTNPSVAMILGTGQIPGISLLYDYIPRRHINSEGLRDFPAEIIRLYENFLQSIRESMEAKIELIYGGSAQSQILEGSKFDMLPLWDRFKGITLFLDREENYSNAQPGHIYRRIVLFSPHPQFLMLQPAGSEWNKMQDKLFQIAALIGRVPYFPGYFENRVWALTSQRPKVNLASQFKYLHEPFGPLPGAPKTSRRLLKRRYLKALQAEGMIPTYKKVEHKTDSSFAKLDDSSTLVESDSRSLAELDKHSLDVLHDSFLEEPYYNILSTEGLLSHVPHEIEGIKGPESEDEVLWRACVRSLGGSTGKYSKPVECWCVRCRERTVLVEEAFGMKTPSLYIDREPLWTIGADKPKYIQRVIKCKVCKDEGRSRKGQEFIPTDANIPSISKQRLSLLQKEYGWQLSLKVRAQIIDGMKPTG